MKIKAIFIVPGYKHKPNSKTYKKIAIVLKKQGYHPIPVKIPWKQTTISENTQYFLKKYKKIRSKKKYILGFSYGAMIAFIASTKVNVSGIILCSMSPYFREDISKVNIAELSPIRKLRYQDFLTLHCETLAKQTKAKKIRMLYGTKETKPLIRRVTEAFDFFTTEEKYLVRIKATEHNIGDRRYLQTIHYVAREMN